MSKYLVLLLFVHALLAGAEDAPKYVFNQTKKGLLPEQEWNRELNVKNPSKIGVIIESENSVVLTLVKDSAIQKMQAGQAVGKDDLVLTEDIAKPPYKREIALASGKYWFVIMNNGSKPADITMKWYKPSP